METTYTTPGGNYFDLYGRLLNAGHTLIAGAQGSGKSTVIQGIIHTALLSAPYENQLIIIDPKRVDMIEYKDMPHVLKYATEAEDISQALDFALSIMETRYNDMQARRLKDYDGSNLYVIIDEVADLMVNPINKKVFSPKIQRLAQLERAARITVIMATQCTLRAVIDTQTKCNFPSRLALRTACAQDSRNIIDTKGAETLPNPRIEGRARAMWRNGADVETVDLPRYSEEERERVIKHWKQYAQPDKSNKRRYSNQRVIAAPVYDKPKRRGLLSRLFG